MKISICILPYLFCSSLLAQTHTHMVGNKNFEIGNHLGNVLKVTIDRKVQQNTEAEIVAFNDYYPFGMLMEVRHGQKNTSNYRFAFQGQEKDDEIKGVGISYNYTYRMHDSRLGRFFAVDPLASKYPHYSTYQFSGNRLMDAIEFEGLEEKLIEDPGSGNKLTKIKKVDAGTIITTIESTEWTPWQNLEGSGRSRSRVVSIEEDFEPKIIKKGNPVKRKKKRGFHFGIWTYDTEGSVRGGNSLFTLDIGSYKHNLKGERRDQAIMPYNPRQQANYFKRIHKKNMKILEAFNYGLDEKDKWNLIELAELARIYPDLVPKFKDPRVYAPKFRIELFKAKGTWWKRKNKKYRKKSWYKEWKKDQKLYKKEKREIERTSF